MTPDEQRIAIAEFCGWKWRDNVRPIYPPCGGWFSPEGHGPFGPDAFPDYLNDLNSIHEAEKKLTDEQWSLYRLDLTTVCEREDKERLGYTPTHQSFWHATATQRAEALLRTLGLWKETQPRTL